MHAILLALAFIGCGILGVWISIFIIFTSLFLPYSIFLKLFYDKSFIEAIKDHLRDPWND